MSSIFPVGSKNKWDWSHAKSPASKSLVKTAQVLGEEVALEETHEDEGNANYDAVKDLPIFKSVEVTDTQDVPALPASPTDVAVETETKSATEDIKEVAQEIKDVATQVEQISTKIQDAAEKAGEEVAKAEELKKDDSGKECPPCDAKMDENKPKKMEKEGDKDKEPREPKDEKTGNPCAKKDETDEKENVEASGKSEFIRLAYTSPQTKKEIREYWLALGFPTEYVNAMIKD